MLHELPKIVRRKKRLGRGVGSRGAKSGRGMKGQRSRAGSTKRIGFEGGQTPLYMRLPKERGAKQIFASRVKKPVAITLSQFNVFAAGEVVGPGQLRKAGLLPSKSAQVKVVSRGDLKHKLTIRAHAITESAQTAVEKAGGKVELIGK